MSKNKSTANKSPKTNKQNNFWQRHKKKIIITIMVLLLLPLLLWKGFWFSYNICMKFDTKRQNEEIIALLKHPLVADSIPGVARKGLKIVEGSDECFNPVPGFSIDPRPRIRFKIVSDSGKSLTEARAALIEYAEGQGLVKDAEDDGYYGALLTNRDCSPGDILYCYFLR